ncbi:MAG TPA: hypothetical protein VM076_24670 [Gemmatimonadaceae bacterium]|nr:hypothetical protein [Gemmatimonadaceae bacterium]
MRHARVHARHDPTMSARVVRRVEMRYAAGADPTVDRPAHVRAASGIAWVGATLAVIQDDANFIALVDPTTGLAESVALPRGPGGRRLFDDGRGNKAEKTDHEAVTVIATGDGPLLVALGSGSTRVRESIAMVAGLDQRRAAVRSVVVPRLYAGLRECTSFAGSQLNVEGAIFVDGRLRLFGRGNGAVLGDVHPVNATCELEWAALRAHIEDPDQVPPPVAFDVVQYALGSIDNSALSFTDATTGWESGNAATTVLYSAAAEASPDATRDGDVVGSAIGVIAERSGETTARWTELQDRDGRRLALKAEGIVVDRHAPDRLLVVVDVDSHDEPSDLLDVRLEGSWPTTAARSA